MRFLDVFAGIGGFHLAASNLGLECVGAIEFDKDAQETYLNNFGITPMGDITKLDLEKLPAHDLLLAGFPCQPFSRNGKYYNKADKKLDETDDRTGLVDNLIKILELHKPKYFLFENVKEILTILDHKGNLFINTLLKNLEDTGYKISYKVLNSSDYGLAQQRRRVFFIGSRDGSDLIFPESFPKESRKYVKDILEVEVADKHLLTNLWRNKKTNAVPENARPTYKVANHKFPKGTSRLEAILDIYNRGLYEHPLEPVHKIAPISILYGDTPSGLPRQQDKVYSIFGIAPTIATFSTPCFDVVNGWRRLTPRECARLQGFPDEYKLPKSDSKAYKQLGNAVSVPVVRAILKNIVDLEAKV